MLGMSHNNWSLRAWLLLELGKPFFHPALERPRRQPLHALWPWQSVPEAQQVSTDANTSVWGRPLHYNFLHSCSRCKSAQGRNGMSGLWTTFAVADPLIKPFPFYLLLSKKKHLIAVTNISDLTRECGRERLCWHLMFRRKAGAKGVDAMSIFF